MATKTKKNAAKKKAQPNKQPVAQKAGLTADDLHKYCSEFAAILAKGGARNVVILACTQEMKGATALHGSIAEIGAMLDYEKFKLMMRQHNKNTGGMIPLLFRRSPPRPRRF